MKRETAEQWMLLEQSGELGPIRRWRLRRHLARHPQDRQFLADADRIMRDARTLADIPELSAQARAAIRVAASERAMAGTTLRWQPALAFAVLAIALLGGWFLLRSTPETVPAPQVAKAPAVKAAPDIDLAWDNGIDAEIREMENLFAMSPDDTDTTETQNSDASDIESIASELLQLEGYEI
ncbi:MAG: hypothetical protein V1929_03960 [bacterium]